MPVMTRKATAQDMELKLRTALQGLKESKEQCDQLLLEREESEKEINNIIIKNTSLKRELVDISQRFQDIVDERDQLRVITDGFRDCSNLYEEALCKIRDLQDELNYANSKILNFQKEKESNLVRETSHLYNELLNCNADPHPMLTIDLTEDSLIKQNNSVKISNNKLKKYSKLNRIIKKCHQYKKQHKLFSKYIPFRKERVDLINKMNNYQIKLEDSKRIYEIDTQHLQSEIKVLENSLSALYSKYVQSQNQIKEHILATNELVLCQCTCQSVSDLDAGRPEALENLSQAESTSQDFVIEQGLTDSEEDLSHVDQAKFGDFPSYNSQDCSSSVMFSDSMGRGLSKLINNNLHYSTLNYCLPGSSYKNIMNLVTRRTYHYNTNLTVFIGNSFKVKQEDITEYVTELLKLNCKKIILCAFPYYEHLSKSQNNYIHKLNKHMYFLVNHYSDKFMFFDTNTFVEHLKSTRDTSYLPVSFRHKIARLLAYFINTDISSMSKSSIIKATMFSSNTKNHVVSPCNVSTTAINSFITCTKEFPYITMEQTPDSSLN
ncbi:hypothetical protein PYW08_005969 [Mythimna loreyi]|uniref:Uncharacterized protein n=1 Tax=Mythimna loreyi TaxID=667449 RepID=A0ACC2QLB8_9NEOP|nr:hypothetical protein PYW08_005969 [Mythimna loreyi]